MQLFTRESDDEDDESRDKNDDVKGRAWQPEDHPPNDNMADRKSGIEERPGSHQLQNEGP